jgi:hypothetical protein
MPTIVNERGQEITLSTRQKNAIYHQAKSLREDIKHGMLTKSELWDASESNIRKHLRTESDPRFVEKAELWKKQMSAIGAEPNDISTERMRKGRR